MLSLLLGSLKRLLIPPDNDDRDLADVIERLERDKESKSDAVTIDSDSFDEYVYKYGIVTDVGTEFVSVDELYSFKIKDLPPENVRVGTKLYYLGHRRNKNEEMRIVKVLSVVDDQWDGEGTKVDAEPVRTESIARFIVGKVARREMRRVFLEQNDISFVLDDVESDFVPYVGDWVKLEAVVVATTNPSDANYGDVLRVDRVTPLRSKLTTGIVTTYNATSKFGVIDRSIVFNKSSCEPGYTPVLGDKVVTDCIESNQTNYCWRSLSVVLVAQQLATNVAPCSESQYRTKHVDNKTDASREASYNISVTTDLSLNLELFEEKDVLVEIINTGPYKQTLQRGCFLCSKSTSQLTLLQPTNINETFVLQPGEKISYQFRCRARFVGRSEEAFVFIFRNFRVRRSFRVNVSSKLIKDIGSKVENVGQQTERKLLFKQNEFDESAEYVTGIKPFKSPKFVAVASVTFKIPQYLWDIALRMENKTKSFMESVVALEEAVPSLSREFTIDTYKDRFHALLHLENIAESLAIQRYDINDTHMRRCAEFLSLEVPGLAEKRPSLLVGDKAIVSLPWDTNSDKLYEGFVHKVLNSEILLKFNPSFHDKYNGERCDVTFKCSQNTIRRSHTAINLATNRLGREFLFPSRVVEKSSEIDLREITKSFETETNDDSTISNLREEKKKKKKKKKEEEEEKEEWNSRIKKRKLVWFNESLNIYQKEAVRNVLRSPARPLPYVIFGPPGTGKTMTVCELILQIFKTMPESRILVATPSNSSANLITERLLNTGLLKPGDLVRLVGYHCLEDDSIPENLLAYCTVGDIALEGTTANASSRFDNKSRLPKKSTNSVLGRHRITVGTCIALGILHNMGFPRGHFSHVLVDEAGQATEPEIMVPLNFIHSDHGHAILAGDPMQLGPVVRCKFAKHFGLGVSFLSRLLQRFPYQRDTQGFERGYDSRLVTKLRMNYRSLPEILHLPNSLFYDSELEPQISIDGKEGELLSLVSSVLPDRSEEGPPAIVFHGIVGTNYQDEDSPSWYNPEEAVQVYFYVVKLYNYGLEADDIGIIAPYQKQVRTIRELLTETNLALPKVGSVEEFQGQERNVIILSAVRSASDFVQDDVKRCLGFIASPNRLNVAITRSRALLLILGNPRLLSQDPCWRSIITYCIEHKAYTGCEFSLGL